MSFSLSRLLQYAAIWNICKGKLNLSKIFENAHFNCQITSGHAWQIGGIWWICESCESCDNLSLDRRYPTVEIVNSTLIVILTHNTTKDSRDADALKRFRDHTQLIKTSKKALTLTEQTFFDSTDFLFSYSYWAWYNFSHFCPTQKLHIYMYIDSVIIHKVDRCLARYNPRAVANNGAMQQRPKNLKLPG